MNSNDLLQDLLTGTLSETDASDSSDEDDQFIKEPPTKITRIENFVEETVPQYSDAVFQEHFRMCRRVVDFIIGYFAQSAYKAASIGGRDKVSNEKAILLSLWYLANTETFRQVADRFNVSRSAHRCLVRVITFLASIKHEYIVWPCKNEAKHIGEEFEKKQGIKNVIGAIDGCHIRINKPKLNQDSYVNRKDVYCGEPGSLHDARLLRKSTLYAKAAENEDIFYNVFVGRLGISMS
ncbi:putative nuclease HARBI1 isoform X3 [Photinus pyralis]|uniref:putative nuclease HARBI1 isoform X3 n=1 Tax=Photinus pyralis TaxID=7054 RepID=UPI00126722E8|nr:putative nuclease HARBI1 isoform X3 [Photinus pyralis]